MEMPSVGTHIKVNRLGYSHHGIYFGVNKVVHYSGFAQIGKKGTIKYTTFLEFLGGQKNYDIVNYPKNMVKYSPEVTPAVNSVQLNLGDFNYAA